MKREILKNKTKIFSIILTIFIIGILITTGAVQAFILGITLDKTNVEKGEVLRFTGTLEIGEEEFTQVNYFVLKLDGPTLVECLFDTDGNPISGCQGISITKISEPYHDNNYGYAYQQGEFVFNITLDTSYYPAGIYSTAIGFQRYEETVFESGENLTIYEHNPISVLEGCSLRAVDSTIIAEQTYFKKRNKLSFNIPRGNAKYGIGSLSSQDGKNRLTFKFKIKEVLLNNDDLAIVAVSGKYKIGRNSWKEQEATIHYDKIREEVSVYGDDISAKNMQVTFSRRC